MGVHNFKQGVQGSNVHELFNPASPRRSPLFPARPLSAVYIYIYIYIQVCIHIEIVSEHNVKKHCTATYLNFMLQELVHVSKLCKSNNNKVHNFFKKMITNIP